MPLTFLHFYGLFSFYSFSFSSVDEMNRQAGNRVMRELRRIGNRIVRGGLGGSGGGGERKEKQCEKEEKENGNVEVG